MAGYYLPLKDVSMDVESLISEIRNERCGYNLLSAIDIYRGDVKASRVSKLSPVQTIEEPKNSDIDVFEVAVDEIATSQALQCARIDINSVEDVPVGQQTDLPVKLVNPGKCVFKHITVKTRVDDLEPPQRILLKEEVRTFYPDLQSKTSKRIEVLKRLAGKLDSLDFKRTECEDDSHSSRRLKSIGSELGIPEAGSSSKKRLVLEIKKLIALYTSKSAL